MSRYDLTEDERADLDNRDSAIETINCLYPPDSEYEDTRRLGLEDMLCAQAAEWRSLPVSVLQHMARAQQYRDNHT